MFVEGENPDHPGMNESIETSAFWGNDEGELSGYVALGAGCVTGKMPVFASTDVSDPDYMQLTETTPPEILHGASDGSQMGAALTAKPNGYRRTIFRQLHSADGVPDTVDGYKDGASLALSTDSPDADSSMEAFAWIADDFSNESGAVSMMLIRFGSLFGSGAIQIPAKATILSARLKVNVYSRYMVPPSVIKCYTGLTDWYTTYQQSDFSTAAWRRHGAGEAWHGGTAADRPRHGVDYRDTSIDIPFNPTGGDSLGDFITIDVTTDVQAYQAGTLANNGWWFGTNQAQSVGKYQLAGMHSSWELKPSLWVVWQLPLPCSSVPEDALNIADVNRDCSVDMLDLHVLAANWLDCVDPEGCP